jgi:hypothetical protein
MTKKNQQQISSSQTKELYTQYTIRIRKGSLASQGLAQHAQRFNSRYEAGWLATLIEEFYVLLDGPDPRASLLYPLLYHRFEPSVLSIPVQAPVPSLRSSESDEEENSQEGDLSMNLTDLQDMAKNLQGFFDDEEEPAFLLERSEGNE